jgi:cytochrome c oxidase assembly protein subunit 15
VSETTVESTNSRFGLHPRTFTRLATITTLALGLIVVSGAAVRLTGSGLGCPDWPSCYQHQLVASASIHPLIEFTNRMVTIAITVLIAVTVVVAHLRSPKRRDLILLSWLLVLGVVGDAVLGGIVVYTKLNPYLVMTHMWLSLAMVAVGMVTIHRSRYDYSPGARADVASPATKKVSLVIVGLFIMVVMAGTATTGTGPHAGGSQGQLVAKRIPVALRDMVMVHSAFAVAFVGVLLATFVILEGIGAPARLRGAAKRLFLIGLAQGAIGFIQFATHLPALLVELHVLGAVSLTMGVTGFQLAQVSRDKESWVTASKTKDPVPVAA